MPNCSKCQSRAVLYQKYSGMRLCGEHFKGDVQRKVKENLRGTSLFGHRARIGIGLSGGNKSSVLLYILKDLFSSRKDIELVAIMIDEGCQHQQRFNEALSIARRLKIPFVVKKCIMQLSESIAEGKDSPSKTDLIHKAAMEIGADALATGHNLDDEAARVLVCLLQGDLSCLKKPNAGGPVWIKPLQRVPEKEIRLYAILEGIYAFQSQYCVEKEPIFTKAHELLKAFDSKHPGTQYSLLRTRDRILSLKDIAGGQSF